MDQLHPIRSDGLPDSVVSKRAHLFHSIKSNQIEIEKSMKRRKLSDEVDIEEEKRKIESSAPEGRSCIGQVYELLNSGPLRKREEEEPKEREVRRAKKVFATEEETPEE